MKEIFPTNPIQEVIVEIKFPLNLRIAREICEFQDTIKSEYPNVTLEELASSKLPTDIRYIFQNEKQNNTIFVERERLVFVSNDYYSFDSFSKGLIAIFESFTTLFFVEKIISLRLNFINIINGNEDNYSALGKYVIPPLGVDLVNLSNEVTQFAVQVVKHKKKATLVTSSALIPDESAETQYRYILDIDSMMDDLIDYSSFIENLSILNDYVYEEFLLNITDDFKQIMRKNND
jgi:uncharacterized protein (TIGR04255 family)